MNKLIIGNTEYELEQKVGGYLNGSPTPTVTVNGQIYIGKAIPNEKTKPKTYEITAFNHDGWAFLKDPMTGKFGSEQLTEAECIANGEQISSVKRLSDSVEFSIGDKVKYSGEKCSYENFIIDNFFVRGNSILARNASCTLCEFITDIKKLKQKIFTTANGEDIFEGETAWYVNNGFEIHEFKHIPDWFNKLNSKEAVFSTRAAADVYVLANKPLFSAKELIDILSKHRMKLAVLENDIFNIAKEKILGGL